MNTRTDPRSPHSKRARVLVVDDHPLVREGLMQLIQRQDDLCCCGTVENLNEALKAVASLQPDLVTIDIRLQQGDGLDLIKALTARHTPLLTLVISQCDEQLYAERALKAGAHGYVMKDRATDEVLTAIRTILEGGLYLSPQIAVLALNKLSGNRADKRHAPLHALSDRELQVLQLLGAGLSTRKVAARLFLSIKTVEAHRENIKHKLDLPNAAELIGFATEWVNAQSSQHMRSNLTRRETR